MKNYAIEVRRIKAIGHAPGLLRLQVDVQVQPLGPTDEDGAASSSLTLSEDNARLLLMLLRQQFTDIDKRKGRSQR